ncbi:MAG: DM13 domain-containing protein [Candidatus Magasanikbacteria bacterium]|nr:DM13 domain-containing protein [Candidatus Magasanikbacteria bacterium]MCA9391228.1 DM13 domain-containing protein [Candidatus Magasanikbacteria bacterium]USN52464.1 MAG: DM13 domain-containing protein [Candidatus Nomurabacteria bacterium]
MKKQMLTVGIVLMSLTFGWAFLRYGYYIGFTPTEFALARMDDGEKRLALTKAPTGEVVVTELTTEQKQAENNYSIEVLSEGIPERIANFTSADDTSVEGMVRIVSYNQLLYVVFDESVTLTPAPTLRVYLTKNGTGTFGDNQNNTVDLGELKSARGTQVYEIPSTLTLDEIKSIDIVNVPYQLTLANAVIN